LWLHRKGAAPTDLGPIVIPGSRGALSYLVLPNDSPDKQQYAGFSVAHGAGRRWARGKAVQAEKFKNSNSLTTTSLGSKVICEDKDLLFEEAPEAYKDIIDIISDLTSMNIVNVIATFRPLITYKCRASNFHK